MILHALCDSDPRVIQTIHIESNFIQN